MIAVELRHKAQRKYVEKGFILVKLRPHSKRPMEQNWVNLPLRKKFKVNGNYGVVLQHDHLVIDVDPRNFKDKDSFEKLKEDACLTKTFIVVTGAGGFHYYYKKPASLVIKKTLSDYPGIEFATKGSQVVGPGSIHPETKKMYKPYSGTRLDDIVQAPAELLNMIAETHPQSGAPRHRQAKYMEDEASVTRYQHYLNYIEGATQGQQGDEHTYKVAAYGKDIGLSPDTTYEMMLDHWNDKCHPPWGIRDLKSKVKNAYSYGVNQPGCAAYDNIFGEVENVPVIQMTKEGLTVNNFVNACFFIGSPEIRYVGAGQTEMAPHNNPVGDIIRYNTLTNRLEFKSPAPWHSKRKDNDKGLIWKTIEVTDAEVINIKYYLDEMTGLKWGRRDIQDAVVKVAHDNKYNPVVDWLDELIWDGEKRLEDWLSVYCGAKSTRYVRAVGLKTMCAAVARAYNPGIKFDHMLILEGAQGIGKSTAVNILAGSWYIDIMLRTDTKDTVQLINGAWIIEVSEMAGLRKQDVESLKAFISRPTDSIRPPFGKTPIDYPRKSIFIGTINPTSIGYLNDETGNRRYWPVLCKKVNMSHLKRDREQLFAEAIIWWRKGEKLYITNKEVQAQAIMAQEGRSVIHPWQQVIEKYFAEYPDVKRTTVNDLYVDAINGDIARFRYTDKNMILTILHRLNWKRNKSGQYVHPELLHDIEILCEGL